MRTLVLIFFTALPVSLHAETVEWTRIEPGFDFARYELGSQSYVIHPEVYLLRFDPNRFTFQLGVPIGFDPRGPSVASDIREMTKRLGGVAGINGSFFDVAGRPLGLLIMDGKVRQPSHRGGRVLTGIFAIRDRRPVIEHRDAFSPTGVSVALQAGPRLIDDGKVTALSDAEEVSRRSGVAITRRREVILYATVLRFPGASLGEIQHMLIDPALDVVDALNLDGGGSSQMFLEKVAGFPSETLLSGGDAIPVGVVVKRKGE